MFKKLVLIFCTLLSVLPLSAQLASNLPLEYKNGHFYTEGQKLDKSQVKDCLTEAEYRNWAIADHNRTTGLVCTPVGSAIIVSGTALMIHGFVYKGNSSGSLAGEIIETSLQGPVEIAVGGTLLAGGLACTIAGIYYLCKGEKQLKALTLGHNSALGKVSLSSNTNGMGFALNF